VNAGSGLGSRQRDVALTHTVPRPSWAWARVVKACRALSPRAKLCWLEHYALWVTRSACTASAAALGRRISTSQAAVERLRSLFMELNMLDKHDRGSGRTSEWRVTLPLPCRPPSARITDDQCTALAQQLGAYIAYRVDAARSALTTKRVPPISARLAPPTEMRALPPHSSEGGLLYQEVSVAGEAGYAGDAGSSKEGLRGNVQNVHAESEPPAWFINQPLYMQPPEPDDLTDEELDSP